MGALSTGGRGTPELWIGLECTVNRVGDRFLDQCEFNGHSARGTDLELFAQIGARRIRYPFLWETIAPNHAREFDWSMADQRRRLLREHGLEPIAGLLHHGSGPRWTQLTDPGFAPHFARFAAAFARRYPETRDYTPINEPMTTARFSCLYGLWYPHARSDRAFLAALLNETKATVLAMRAIRRVNPEARLVQTEDMGRAQSTPRMAYQARFENHRRWLTFDLLCGSLDAEHPLFEYVTEAGGVAPDDLAWFRDNPCPPDVLGINHYLLSDRFLDERLNLYPEGFHGGNGRDRYADVGAVHVAAAAAAPPYEILLETARRYGRTVAITETHLDGTRESQMRWLAETWRDACRLREEGWPVEAVTAWSLLGSYDWNSLCTVPARYYEPGVFDVRGREPRPTAIFDACRALARDGRHDHPVLRSSGWWHREKRVLFPERAVAPRLDEHDVRSRRPAGPGPVPRSVLVVGASGTLGRAFARQLNARAIDYRLATRSELDIADPAAVARALDELDPWCVINAAGYVKVDLAEIEPERCRRENTEGPHNLAVECARRDTRLLTFSSDLVFDGRQELPYFETSPVAPLNAYGRSKAEAERKVLDACPDRALIVRTSAFFGPWDEFNFVTLALRALAARREFDAPMDLTVSPTYLPDLVNAVLDHALDGTSGILHLANAGEVTWSGLAALVAERAGLDASLVRARPLDELAWPAPRPRYSVLGSRFGKQLPPLEFAIDRYFDELSVDLPPANAPRPPSEWAEGLKRPS